MRIISTVLIVASCVLMNIAAAAERDEPTLSELEAIQRLVRTHCVECHGGEETYAGVNLASLESELDVWQNRAVWSRAHQMIEGGKMPPDDGPTLSDKQRQMLSSWVQHTLDNVDVNRIPRDPGFVPPRRLTGKEYNYTVQDLFGLSEPVYEFPDDLVIGDSFENSADSLSFDALWLEKALDAADATVKAVWSNPTSLAKLLAVRPSPPPVEDESIFVADRETSDRCGTSGDFSIVAKVVGFPERVFLRAPRGVDQTLGSKVLTFDGDALIYRVSQRRALFGDVREMEDGKPHWIGLTVLDGRATLYLDGQLLVTRSGFERPDVADHFLKIGFTEEEETDEEEDEDDEREEPDEDEQNEQEDEEEESFDEEDEESQEEERSQLKAFLFYADTLPDDAMAAIDQNSSENKLPSPTFRWVEGMGTPADNDFVSVEQATEMVTREFLTKAFRRQPSRETIDRYIGLFEKGLDAGLTFEIAAQHPVATALTSPEFLFVRDSPTNSETDYQLSAIDLSNRLSYFLWSSLPDTELRESTKRGLLTDEGELIRQIDRMLADERAYRFFESFVLQWLKTEGLGDTIRPSAERFPDLSDSLLTSMRREGPMFFADAVKHNRSLLNLIESHYSIVNPELAAHYGFEDARGNQWRRVDHRDASRGGVLTQAAVLTVSSSPQRTSPVFRGKWVLEVLLGDPPPPPPPNVPSLPAADSETASSLRESLALHRRQEACAGCHSRIDPYGLALEQFDAVGALRIKPQDTRTMLHTGEKLDGVKDLKQYLATEKKDDFLRHLTRKVLAYALGRELQFSDERAVHKIMEHLKTNRLGARTLIHQVVLSEPFRFRRIPKSSNNPL